MSKNNNISKHIKANGGYFYEVLTNTLHMSKAFQAKANRYGTKECEIVDALTLQNSINPTIKIHTHKRAPRLTYQMMEVFISKMPNAKENFQEYQKACQKSKIARNPYKEVLTWFENAFPYYNDLKVKKDGKLVWNALDEYRKALEEQAARGNNITPFPQSAEADENEVVNA